jgi:hypothetical protein
MMVDRMEGRITPEEAREIVPPRLPPGRGRVADDDEEWGDE